MFRWRVIFVGRPNPKFSVIMIYDSLHIFMPQSSCDQEQKFVYQIQPSRMLRKISRGQKNEIAVIGGYGDPTKSAQDKTAPTKARRQMRAVTTARRTIARMTIARGDKSAHDKSASIVYIIKDKNWKHRKISQSSNPVVYTRKLMQITRHITRDFI